LNHAHHKSADFALQAAVLEDGLAEAQPFVEGNKRAALASMLTFITINGFELNASQEELAAWIIRPSAGLDADGLAELIRGGLVQAGPA